jgi:hypothetical protein
MTFNRTMNNITLMYNHYIAELVVHLYRIRLEGCVLFYWCASVFLVK